MPHLHSWTDEEATRFYSGRALYEKTVLFRIPSFRKLRRSRSTSDPASPLNRLREALGMHALLDSPVREAAVVVVNGKCAGVIWHPPYQLDIKPYLHTGPNQLRIR